jgi:hypothetical protein
MTDRLEYEPADEAVVTRPLVNQLLVTSEQVEQIKTQRQRLLESLNPEEPGA